MKRKFENSVLVFILTCASILCSFENASAQNLVELERKYISLVQNYQIEKSALDSLSKIMNERAEQIDAEKRKPNPDQIKILKLMAGSVNITGALEIQQTKVNQIEKSIESIKQTLDAKYSLIIDSLQNLKRSGKYKGDAEELDAQILIFTERRLAVAPKVKSLSFDPEKILEINLAEIKDSLQRLIYSEYLHSALSEVEKLLTQVNESSEEVSQIILLQKKMNKFLEETEFERPIKQYNLSESISRTFGDIRETSDLSAGKSFIPQFISYDLLLDQLRINRSSELKSKWQSTIESDQKNLTLKDYQNLLKEVKKRLLDYRLILSNKLNSRR